MANQPKTPMVSFRYGRREELEELAKERGVTMTVLMREWCDALLGVTVEDEEP